MKKSALEVDEDAMERVREAQRASARSQKRASQLDADDDVDGADEDLSQDSPPSSKRIKRDPASRRRR